MPHSSDSQSHAKLSEEEFRKRLRELPPSAKLVAKILEYEEPLSPARVANETMLPDRTVRYGLTRLEEAGLVEARYNFIDARKRLYSLTK